MPSPDAEPRERRRRRGLRARTAVTAERPPTPPAPPQPGGPADAEGGPRTEGGVHARQLRNGIISLVLVGALVIAIVFAVPGLRGVERTVRHIDQDTLAMAVGLEVLSCLGYVAAFQLVFYRAPRRFAARLAWTEMAFGSAVSLGGAGSLAVGAWILSARGVPAGRIARRSAVIFMLTSAINVIVLIVVGTLLGLGVVAGPRDPLLSWLPAGVGVAVLVSFLALPRWAERHAQRREERSRTQRLLLGLADSIRDTRQLLLRPDWRLLGAFGYLLFDIAVLWVCLDALGQDVPVASVILAYQIGYLVNVIPVPGGLGVLDSGLIGTLVLYDARVTPAAAAVLVYHAIALWVPTLVGSITFLQLRRTLGEPLVPRPAEPGRY